jgi:hypothetical protein
LTDSLATCPLVPSLKKTKMSFVIETVPRGKAPVLVTLYAQLTEPPAAVAVKDSGEFEALYVVPPALVGGVGN